MKNWHSLCFFTYMYISIQRTGNPRIPYSCSLYRNCNFVTFTKSTYTLTIMIMNPWYLYVHTIHDIMESCTVQFYWCVHSVLMKIQIWYKLQYKNTYWRPYLTVQCGTAMKALLVYLNFGLWASVMLDSYRTKVRTLIHIFKFWFKVPGNIHFVFDFF
jgi:hypothetical protein